MEGLGREGSMLYVALQAVVTTVANLLDPERFHNMPLVLEKKIMMT